MTNLREDDKYFHGNFRRIFLHPSRRSSFSGVLGVGVQIHQGQLLYQLGSFDECAIRTVLWASHWSWLSEVKFWCVSVQWMNAWQCKMSLAWCTEFWAVSGCLGTCKKPPALLWLLWQVHSSGLICSTAASISSSTSVAHREHCLETPDLLCTCWQTGPSCPWWHLEAWWPELTELGRGPAEQFGASCWKHFKFVWTPRQHSQGSSFGCHGEKPPKKNPTKGMTTGQCNRNGSKSFSWLKQDGEKSLWKLRGWLEPPEPPPWIRHCTRTLLLSGIVVFHSEKTVNIATSLWLSFLEFVH